MRVGVLSYQGSVIEHINTLNKIKGVSGVGVKTLDTLLNVDALILPGGESTAIANLLRVFNLLQPLKQRILDGMPVWGTCAGMILLAKEIKGEKPHLGVMDIAVRRNAYGSQLDSFSQRVYLEPLKRDFETVFIRAPWIERVYGDTKILLKLGGNIVAARQKNMLVTSFHPELTQDTGFHEYFLSMTEQRP